MTRRERLLAIVVGVLVLGVGLFWGTKKVAGIFISRSDRIMELNEEIDGKELLCHRGMIARRELDEYAKRSLPGEKEDANNRYRAWLHEWCDSARIPQANVQHMTWRQVVVDKERVFDRHVFSVSFRADLAQLVTLLFDFYAQDYLHRVRSMKATPLDDDNRLLVNFQIGALSIPGVKDRELVDMPSKRLALDSIDDYFDVIVGRNVYSPGNKPPKFASSGTERGYVNQRMSFSPSVDDPEDGQLSYRVEHDGLDGLTIDERSGEIEWTPPETGEFEILVYATDNGLPAKEASQTIRLAVSDPPPPPPPTPTRPTFDEAKYTFVTGIVEVNGRRQVWLTVRTDGQWLRLYEGETFQIGSMDGKVVRIYPRHVEISSERTLYAVRFGQSLFDGQVLSRLDEEVAAAR